MEKKLKSMDNEYQSITGGEGGSMWQQRELSRSLASAWLMPCLAVRGDRDSHNALQTTVWRLNFLQPQSPKPSPSFRSFAWWCLPADRGSNATINSVAMVIYHKPWQSQSSLCCLKQQIFGVAHCFVLLHHLCKATIIQINKSSLFQTIHCKPSFRFREAYQYSGYMSHSAAPVGDTWV